MILLLYAKRRHPSLPFRKKLKYKEKIKGNKKESLDLKNGTQSALLDFLEIGSIINLLIYAIGMILPIYNVDFLGLVKTVGIIGDETIPQGSAYKLFILTLTFICSMAIQMLSKKAVNGELNKNIMPQLFFCNNNRYAYFKRCFNLCFGEYEFSGR